MYDKQNNDLAKKCLHFQSPQACEYATLHRRKDYLDVIKSSDSEMGGYPKLSMRVHRITYVLSGKGKRRFGQKDATCLILH